LLPWGRDIFFEYKHKKIGCENRDETLKDRGETKNLLKRNTNEKKKKRFLLFFD
jgi:hypothetical protein